MPALMLGLGLTLLLSFIPPCWSYGGGAPLSVCSSLQPGHGSRPRDNATSPFTLLLREGAGQAVVAVRLTAGPGVQFKGFLVQARRLADNAVVGSFTVAGEAEQQAQYLNCGGVAQSSVTHSQPVSKVAIPNGYRW